MTKKFVFRSNKYNVTHQDIQRGIEDRGYVDDNPITSAETNVLDKWHKFSANRDDENIFISSSVNISRIQIHDAINRAYDQAQSSVCQISIDRQPEYHSGYNFGKQKAYNFVEEYLLNNPASALEFISNPQQFIVNLPGLPIKNIIVYEGGENLNNRTLPVIKINSDPVSGHHKDGRYEKGLQGPYTEHSVGGYKHRHQPIGSTTDRPERFKMDDDGANITFTSPISGAYGLDYNIPYSRFSRDGFTKAVVGIKNVQTSTSGSGNYLRRFEIINGLHRRSQNLALVDRPGNFSGGLSQCPIGTGVTDTIVPDRRLLDNTYNKTVFVNKFGAPGDAFSASKRFLDYEAEELSPYNTVNYRNFLARKTIKGLLSTPSYFGGYESGSFGLTASYQKTQRNNRRIPVSGTSNFRLREDNKYQSYGIPARDGGYLWIKNYATTGNNPGLYTNGIDNDITFITSAAGGLFFSPVSGNYYTISGNNTLTLDPLESNVLRRFNVQQNGMWNFSTKQQMLQNYNKIIAFNKKSSQFTDFVSDSDNSQDYKSDIRFMDSPIKDKHTNIINVYSDGKEEERLSYPLGQTYASLASDFYRAEQNKIINLYKDHRNIRSADKSKSLFSKLLRFDRFAKKSGLDCKKIKEIIYEEKIFPKGQNVFRNITRTRISYYSKWSDTLSDRTTELTNSQGNVYIRNNFLNQISSGQEYGFSFWPMDTYTTYNTDLAYAIRDKSGELLQIDNVSFYTGTYGTDPGLIVPSGSYFAARFGRNWNVNRPANVVHEQAGRGPYSNLYDTFSSEMRIIGKNCATIPEYRISTAIDLYNDSTGSIYDRQYNSLELTGSVIESANFSIASSSVFMEEKSHSDFIELNQHFNRTIQEYKLDKIKLKIKAVKKFLPYENFYPQTRMVSLAGQFSSSYNGMFELTGSQATFRTALTSLYAPGVGFNSIKAGVGMPFPIVNVRNGMSVITKSVGSSSAYYYKLPWEAVLYPEIYMQQIPSGSIYDTDTDMRIDSTASIVTTGNPDKTYDKMSGNFYSEVINFFKDTGKLTTIKSKPDTEWYFPDLTKKYSLDIVINKSSDFLTYSSLENFGPKPYVYHVPPWYSINEANATGSSFNSDVSLTPDSFCSAGESYVRVVFDPSLLCSDSSDYLTRGIFKSGDILRNSTFEYYSTPFGGCTSSAVPQITDMVDIFSMSNDSTVWQPKLKWECPTADLNFCGLSAKLTNSVGNDGGGNSAGDAIRGIWHQYAPMCNTNDGLFLSIRDSGRDESLTGSLLDVVGFDKREKNKIGKIASSKEISESLIIIPFYVDSCSQERFFDIDINEFEESYVVDEGFISKIKKVSRDYILPPSMDFISIRDRSENKLSKEEYGIVKSPFLFFSTNFSTILDKQDLVDIWQGVAPQTANKIEVEHRELELDVSDYLKNFNYKLPDNTRFKIFKVKQRAVNNYQDIIDRTIGKDVGTPSYGYNWPYDFFSLVEMAEVKVELTYKDETV